MTELLNPGWWFWGVAESWRWLLFCLLVGAVALPLTLRLFRGLPDRGAGLCIGAGLLLVTWMTWFAALERFGAGGPGSIARTMLLVLSLASMGALAVPRLMRRGKRSRRRGANRGFALAGCGVLIAIAPLPHTGFAAWFMLVLLAVAGGFAWSGEGARLLQTLRRVAAPLAASALLFVVSFVFFTNVRSHVPDATFEAAHSGAEKFGNLAHLSALMRSTQMPPGDAWFLGEPSNYYYAGHLVVATVAKATGTETAHAFNLGVATLFALVVSMAFSFTLNLVEGWGRRCRMRGVRWTRGIAWGCAGALAVGFFGNLDAVQQFASGVASWTAGEGFAGFDYWRSSRTIHGAPHAFESAATITEFPAFSALLGDLHAHHLALVPWMLLFSACLALHLKCVRGRLTGRQWLARCGLDLVVIGGAAGMLAATNSWDVVPGAILVPLAVISSVRAVEAGPAWRWVTFGIVALLAGWFGGLLFNLVPGSVPIFSFPVVLPVAAVVALLLGLQVARSLRRNASGEWAPVVLMLCGGAGLFVLVAVAGFLGARSWQPDLPAMEAMRVGSRDGLLVLATTLFAAWVAFSGEGFAWRGRLALGLCALALAAVVAVASVFPWAGTFRSPMESERTLLIAAFPPVAEPAPLVRFHDFATEFWEGTPVRPNPPQLRTAFGDFLVHWGLFVIPALLLAGAALLRRAWRLFRPSLRTRPTGGEILFGTTGLLIGLWAVGRNHYQSFTTATLMVAIALLAVLLVREGRSLAGARWLFLLHAAIVLFFVEVFHIKEAMSGDYARYNTYFKLTYALWIPLAACAVALFRDGAHRLRRRETAVVRAPSLLLHAGGWASGALFWAVLLLALRSGMLRTFVFFVGLAMLFALLVSGFRFARCRDRSAEERLAATLAAGTRRAPLVAGLALFLFLGLIYPVAGTMMRTGHLQGPLNGDGVRTLDALAWMEGRALFSGDREAAAWLYENAPSGALILEAPPLATGEDRLTGQSYSAVGRLAAMSGVPTLVGWPHHQMQWRGWRTPVPPSLAARFSQHLTLEELGLDDAVRTSFPEGLSIVNLRALKHLALEGRPVNAEDVRRIFLGRIEAGTEENLVAALRESNRRGLPMMDLLRKMEDHAERIYTATALDAEVVGLIRFYGIEYVAVGELERRRFPGHRRGLAKFEAWPVAFEAQGTRLYRVPSAEREDP